MLSPSDTAIVFLLALLLFGPEQLPKLARQLGEAMRHIQTTTQSFMLEMERAAQAADERGTVPRPAGGQVAAIPEFPTEGAAFDPGRPAEPPDAAFEKAQPDAPSPGADVRGTLTHDAEPQTYGPATREHGSTTETNSAAPRTDQLADRP
jgi:sec-independent protein translocase protein TatB